jgi:hypothetical protein
MTFVHGARARTIHALGVEREVDSARSFEL